MATDSIATPQRQSTASLTLAAIWSLLQRGPAGHPRLGRWLHLVVRFDLAFTMLSYGTSKLYGGQFGELSLDRLTQEIGDTWPMAMVGTFMQASKPYEVFGGLGGTIALRPHHEVFAALAHRHVSVVSGRRGQNL